MKKTILLLACAVLTANVFAAGNFKSMLAEKKQAQKEEAESS